MLQITHAAQRRTCRIYRGAIRLMYRHCQLRPQQRVGLRSVPACVHLVAEVRAADALVSLATRGVLQISALCRQGRFLLLGSP